MRSIKVLAIDLDISQKTIRRWIDSGSLKAVKLGGLWRISDEEYQKLQMLVYPPAPKLISKYLKKHP